MRVRLREAAGMTAAWTVMGVTFAAAAAATAAIGVIYLLAAGAHGARAASTTIRKKNKGEAA